MKKSDKKEKKRRWQVFVVIFIVIVCIKIFFGYRLIYRSDSDGAIRTWLVNNLPVAAASVNGDRILLRDFEKRVADTQYFFEQQKKYNANLVEERSKDEIQEGVLKSMIDRVLLEEIAAEYDVRISDKDVATYYRDVIVAQEPRGESVIEEDLQRYYHWTPEEFQRNELYSVVLSLRIADALRGDDKLNKGPLQRAQEIRTQIVNEPAKPFSEFAKELSEDETTATAGGMIGFIARGQYDPFFEEAVFTLPAGEVSEPIRSHIGYHLIKVTNVDDDAGTREVRHILIKTPSVEDLLKEKRDTARIKKRIPKK